MTVPPHTLASQRSDRIQCTGADLLPLRCTHTLRCVRRLRAVSWILYLSFSHAALQMQNAIIMQS